MTPWKLLVMIFVLVLPGGSLVLLAMAAAKAWGAGKERLKRSTSLSAQQAAVVAEGAKA